MSGIVIGALCMLVSLLLIQTGMHIGVALMAVRCRRVRDEGTTFPAVAGALGRDVHRIRRLWRPPSF